MRPEWHHATLSYMQCPIHAQMREGAGQNLTWVTKSRAVGVVLQSDAATAISMSPIAACATVRERLLNVHGRGQPHI